MKDELKKLGLRIRPRVVEPREQQSPSSRARSGSTIAAMPFTNGMAASTEEGDAGDRARNKALANPGLAIVEEDGPANAPIRSNPKGLRVGYNPYESGLLARKGQKKKPDLRELSKWMEAKRKAKPDGTEE